MLTVLTLPLWAQALVTIGGALLVALSLRWLIYCSPSGPTLDRARDVANLMRQPTTTFVALTLALSGVEVISELHRAGADAGREASVLERLHRDSVAYGGIGSAEFGETLVNYVQSIVDVEWDSMRGMGESRVTKTLFDQLLVISHQMRAADTREQMWLTDMVSQLNVAADLRRARISHAQESMPLIFYAVSISSCLVVLGFASLAPQGWGGGIIIGSYAVVVGLALLLVVSLDLPFSGTQGVKPDDFKAILENIHLRTASRNV